MFSPRQSNRAVLSCPQGDTLQINFCEIINILKNNKVLKSNEGCFIKFMPGKKKLTI